MFVGCVGGDCGCTAVRQHGAANTKGNCSRKQPICMNVVYYSGLLYHRNVVRGA